MEVRLVMGCFEWHEGLQSGGGGCWLLITGRVRWCVSVGVVSRDCMVSGETGKGEFDNGARVSQFPSSLLWSQPALDGKVIVIAKRVAGMCEAKRRKEGGRLNYLLLGMVRLNVRINW